MNIEYSKKAIKYIESVDKQTKKRLREAIEKLPNGDVRKLKGLEGYRLRVGDLRVLFSMEDEIQAFLDGKKDRIENGTVSHDDINWD